jgi:ribulose 1,5-bisphosphate carboxylase large subunit-like protein
VAALRRAWEAAVEGVSLDDLARRDPDVALAVGIGR